MLRLFVRRLLWEPRRSSLFNSCGAGARAGRRLYEGRECDHETNEEAAGADLTVWL